MILFTELLAVVGTGLIAYGCYLIDPPWAFLSSGAIILLLSVYGMINYHGGEEE